jgi:hypothetical protein
MKIAAPHNFVRNERFTWKRLVANKIAIATRSFPEFRPGGVVGVRPLTACCKLSLRVLAVTR